MKRFLSIVFAALFIFVLCAEKSFAANAVDWSKQTITVTGMGFAPPGNYRPEHAKQLAKRAAITEAYRQLAEAVNGVRVTGETTVNAMTLVSDVIKTKVEATINGVQPVSEREIADGGYEVTLQMPLFGRSNSLAGIVLERPVEKISFPEPVINVAPTVPAYTSTTPVAQRIDIVVNGANNVVINTRSAEVNISADMVAEMPQVYNPTPYVPQIQMPEVKMPEVPQYQVPTSQPATEDKITNAKVSGDYTGLIVDCRNLDLQPVMSPTIQTDSNETIYGNKNLDYDKIIEFGAVSYATDVEDTVVERAGDNPIVVKAESLKNFNSCPVISTADSNFILIENKSGKFLEDMNVVFMM